MNANIILATGMVGLALFARSTAAADDHAVASLDREKAVPVPHRYELRPAPRSP